MKKLLLLLLTVFSVSLLASAQTRTVTGTVIDAHNDDPLIGVSVIPGASKTGVATDIDGNFAVSVPAGVKTLKFEYLGYEPKTVQITSNNMIVKLESSAEMLNDVVVTGYGNVKRSEYTGSAGAINAKQLEDAVVSNVTNAVSGKIAGVQTLSSNGQPGTSSTILVRGVGSINAGTSPLYVVDGMIFDGDISSIPTQDIESFTVIKDAASTALYGARGANGVVQIVTKKGKEGQATVTFDMKWGSNSRAIPQYDVISDQRQYLETFYKAIYNAQTRYVGMSAADAHAYANKNLFTLLGYQTWTKPDGQDWIGTNGKFNPNATPGYTRGNYTYLADDWTKETLINGMRQEYNMSVTGGTQRLMYYASASYLQDEGIIIASHFNRLSTRLNVDYQAKDWLKIGANMQYSYTNSGYPDGQTLSDSSSTGNAFNLMNSLGPVYPMYIRDAWGNIAYNTAFGNKIYDYGDGAEYIIGAGRTNAVRATYAQANAVGSLHYDISDILSDIFNGKWYAQLTPLKGLTITGSVGYYVDNTRYHSTVNGLYGQFTSSGGQAQQEADRSRTINLQLLAQYQRSFGDHNVSLMVGAENSGYQSEYTYAIGSNLYNPVSWAVNNTIDQLKGGGAQSTVVHRGFLANLKYTYSNRYYLTAAIRRDGSSRFAPGKQWGTFWSFSGAWDMANEEFMQDTKNYIDMLKVRASFGQNGNDLIRTGYINAYSDWYKMSGADGVFSDGTLASKGNKNITWETSNSFNAGFDFSFFKRRVSGSAEYYSRQTSDMLFSLPVAPSLGYSSIPSNVGSMRNNGVEVDLNINLFNTKDFTWDVFGNITFAKNKVIKLDSSILNTNSTWRADSQKGWLSGSYMYLEGQSMYNLWIVKYAGVNKDNGRPLYWALKNETTTEIDPATGQEVTVDKTYTYIDPTTGEEKKGVCKVEYLTEKYSEAYNTNRQGTGNLMPKAYGGFGTNLSYKGFDLSLAFSYQFGGRIFDSSYQSYMYSGDGTAQSMGLNWHKDMLNAWTPENPDSNIPALMLSDTYSYNSTSTRFLISSNYVSLNNVTLGYSFPSDLVKKFFLSSLRVYVAAENVALWSKRKGLDPRQSYATSNNSTYSPVRNISGGLKVSF
jgi:TonB-linked SusC/RagA family outer membrane protein